MKKNNKGNYNSLSAEASMDEVIPNWRIFKVSLSNQENESYFIKVCLPMDESLVALCSEKDEPCSEKAKAAETAKRNNEDYLSNIRSHYFLNRPINNTKKKKPSKKSSTGKTQGQINELNGNQQNMNGFGNIGNLASMGMNGIANMYGQNGFMQNMFPNGMNLPVGMQGMPGMPGMNGTPNIPNMPNSQNMLHSGTPQSQMASPLNLDSKHNMMYNFKQSTNGGEQSSLSKPPTSQNDQIKFLKQRVEYLTDLLKRNHIPFDQVDQPKPTPTPTQTPTAIPGSSFNSMQQPFYNQPYNQFNSNGGFMQQPQSQILPQPELQSQQQPPQPQIQPPMQDMNMGMYMGNSTGGMNPMQMPNMYGNPNLYGGLMPGMYGSTPQ